MNLSKNRKMVGNLVTLPKIVVWKIVDHFDARAPFSSECVTNQKVNFAHISAITFYFLHKLQLQLHFYQSELPPSAMERVIA